MTIPRMAIGLLGAVGLNAAMIFWTVVEHYSGEQPLARDEPTAEVQSAADVPPTLPFPLPDASPLSPPAADDLSLDALRKLDPQFLEMATEVYPELNRQPLSIADQQPQSTNSAQLARMEQGLETVHQLTSAALGLTRDAKRASAADLEFVQRRQEMVNQLRAMAAELLVE